MNLICDNENIINIIKKEIISISFFIIKKVLIENHKKICIINTK